MHSDLNQILLIEALKFSLNCKFVQKFKLHSIGLDRMYICWYKGNSFESIFIKYLYKCSHNSNLHIWLYVNCPEVPTCEESSSPPLLNCLSHQFDTRLISTKHPNSTIYCYCRLLNLWGMVFRFQHYALCDTADTCSSHLYIHSIRISLTCIWTYGLL